MPTHDSVDKQARKILDAIASKPFEECHPLNRKFDNIPARPGINAIRHESIGLLYIGKTKSLRGHFRGDHKAFLWAWLDKYDAPQVRIAFEVLAYSRNPT